MLLAAVHLPLAAALPFGLALAALLGWYWSCLQAPGIPPSRRWIRRISVALMLAVLAGMLLALSVFDRAVVHRLYLTTWMLSLCGLLLVVGTAVADFVNSLRLLSRQVGRENREAATRLKEALEARRLGQGR